MNTIIIIGILLMLPLVYTALFQTRSGEWDFNHKSIAILGIAGFLVGIIFLLVGVLA